MTHKADQDARSRLKEHMELLHFTGRGSFANLTEAVFKIADILELVGYAKADPWDLLDAAFGKFEAASSEGRGRDLDVVEGVVEALERQLYVTTCAYGAALALKANIEAGRG